MFTRSRGLKQVLTGLAAVTFGVACDGPTPEWTGTTEVLPNGGTRVVNPSGGLWEEGEGWVLRPELSLGVVEGSEEKVFGGIVGLQVDEEGHIHVLDRQANELRTFAADGTYLWTVGRQGEGPGEYVNANGLEWLAPDSLLVIDQRGNRYSVLTGHGEFVRSVPRSLGFYAWAFRGGVVEGWVYETSSVRREEERTPVLLGTSLREEPTGEPEEFPAGPEGPAMDTIPLPTTDAPAYESFSVRNARGGMVMGVPFTPAAVYYLDSEGSLWHGHGSQPRIFRSTLEGDTLLEVVFEAEAEPVTPDELAEWEASEAVQRFRERGGELDLGRIPETKPYFDGLYRDREGYLWVSVPGGAYQVRFAIVDPEGRFLGEVAADGMKRATWVGPVARNGRLYLVGSDELDVQRVYVFTIEK